MEGRNSAVVKITSPGRLTGYLGVAVELISEYSPTRDNMGWFVPAGTAFNRDGEEILKAKPYELIRVAALGNPSPQKYTALVGFNPQLALFGTPICSGMVTKGEPIELWMRTGRDGFEIQELDQLEYMFKIQLID